MSGASLYVATDDAGIASVRLFGCIALQAPAWCVFCITPEKIAAIPDGARCIGLWSTSRRSRTAAEWAWIERRDRGGLQPGLTKEDMEGLAAWIEKRRADTPTVDIGGNLALPDLEREPPSPIPTVHQPAPEAISGAVISSRWS